MKKNHSFIRTIFTIKYSSLKNKNAKFKLICRPIYIYIYIYIYMYIYDLFTAI